MISLRKQTVMRYCSGDYRLIENYAQAVSDETEVWDCHHRDEIRKLPSGMVVVRSVAELIEDGLYWHLPPEYLIFVKHSDHMKMHKQLHTWKRTGIPHTEETKKKMSASAMGHKVSDETRAKLRQFHLGRKASPETRAKMRESHFKRLHGGL